MKDEIIDLRYSTNHTVHIEVYQNEDTGEYTLGIHGALVNEPITEACALGIIDACRATTRLRGPSYR